MINGVCGACWACISPALQKGIWVQIKIIAASLKSIEAQLITL